MEDDLSFNARELVALTTQLWSRAMTARAFGQTAYHGVRDYWEVLGYKVELEFNDYLQAYKRGGIAKRIISLPATDTWRKPPAISEDGKRDTEFVRAWEKLVDDLHVWSWLTRADRLSGIGRYGILVLGFAASTDLSAPMTGQDNRLLYLRAFSEGSADIAEKEDDANSPRYGMPITYDVTFDEALARQRVHWTRAIHIAEGKDDSEIFGTPRLEAAANLVLGDLIKGVGGGAEALWLNMRKSPVFTNQPDFDFGDSDTAIAEQREQIEEFAHGLARYVFGEGLDVKEIGGLATDPRGVVDVILDQIAATIGKPRRILLGSAAGELAAAREDTRQWYGSVAARQREYAEPDILRPFVDRLVQFGALPRPANGYVVGDVDESGNVSWPSLFELTEQEQSEVIRNKAQAIDALRDPLTGRVPATIPEQRQILGLTPIPERGQAELEALVANSQARYERGIRAAVRGLWSGAIDEFDFAGAMGPTIRSGLERAWTDGARAAGVTEEELTPEENAALATITAAQVGYVDRFADHITKNNKEVGGQLSALNPRVASWVNVYSETKNRAMQMARTNPKLQWNLGATKKHCRDCFTYNGRVYRASTWNKHNIRPQIRELGCKGFRCDCAFTETDAPANRGFPPKPTGT